MKFSFWKLNPLVVIWVAACVISLPALALAQTAAPASPSLTSSLLSGAVAFALAHVDVILGALLGLPVVSGFLTLQRKRRIATAIYYAAHIAADVDAEMAPGSKTKSTADKVTNYLGLADKYLAAHGWRPLKPGETAAAQMQAQALVGAAKVSAATPSPAPLA